MADRGVFANQGPTRPNIDKSLFDLSHSNNLTARLGRAYPVLVYDAPAGSSFRIKPRMAFDVQPMLFPIQTPIHAHISIFKIPKRILMKSYKDFIGQHGNHKQPWIARPTGWATTGSLADYMGLPTEKVEVSTDQYAALNFSRIHRSGSYYVQDSTVRDFSDINYPVGSGGVSKTQGVLTSRITEPIYTEDGLFRFEILFDHDLTLSGSDFNEFVGKSLFIQLLNMFSFNENLERAWVPDPDKPKCQVLYNVALSYEGVTNVSDFSTAGWTCPVSEVESVEAPIRDRNGDPIYYTKAAIYIRFTAEMMEFINRGVLNPAYNLHFLMRWDNVLWPYFGQEGSTIRDEVNFDTYVDGDVHTEGDPSELKADLYSRVAMLTYGLTNPFTYQSSVARSYNNTAIFSTSDPAVAPKMPINALPFRAYQFIGNYFFRNERVTPFTIDGEETFNQFITTDADGADSDTPVDFWNVPYEYDLFTTCVPTPQFGYAPLVGITTNDKDAMAFFHMQPVDQETGLPSGSPYDIGVNLDGRGNIMGISNYDDVADKSSVMRLKEAIQFGISINDFRNVNCLQRFQERYLKAGTKYQNIVYEFFGTNPPIGEEFPEYIGGTTSVMNVGKIVNQTGSNDTAVKLGEFAGTGNFRVKGRKIRCFCSEESYIMGILWFSATPTYSQMLPRLFTKFNLLEFYNPQFANIGLQPVYAHQIAPLQLSDAQLTDVFGYNRPFAEYVSMQDEVHGDFRTSMRNFLMQRIFGSKPQLGSDFLYIKPEDLTDVFSVIENDDKIFGQIWFDIKAKLPIPRFAIPRII